jgi:rhodanese-related sulfurtransferase
MRPFKTTSWFFTILVVTIFTSCAGGQKKANQAETVSEQPASQPVEINNEAKLLLQYFESNGDYVNSREFPSLIKAASVFEELNGKIHIIDLRGPKSFAEGHIKGAVKVDFKDLPEYFSSKIKPFEFDKIIVVCYSGQISSYTASLLRLMGYGNVYALRWGMSGWNKDLAYQWLEAISSEYEGKLELTENVKAVAGDFPVIGSGKETGDEIADAQFKKLFESDGRMHLFRRKRYLNSLINITSSTTSEKINTIRVTFLVLLGTKQMVFWGLYPKCKLFRLKRKSWFIAVPVIIQVLPQRI